MERVNSLSNKAIKLKTCSQNQVKKLGRNGLKKVIINQKSILKTTILSVCSVMINQATFQEAVPLVDWHIK